MNIIRKFVIFGFSLALLGALPSLASESITSKFAAELCEWAKCTTKIPAATLSAMDSCEIKRKLNQCEEFEKNYPEVKPEELVSCSPARICEDQLKERSDFKTCIYAPIKPFVEAIRKKNLKIEECDKSYSCKEALARAHPATAGWTREQIEKSNAAFLYTQISNYSYALSSAERGKQTSKFLGDRPYSDVRSPPVEYPFDVLFKAYDSIVAETADKMHKESTQYGCLTHEAIVELNCTRLSMLFPGAPLLKATVRGAELIKILEKGATKTIAATKSVAKAIQKIPRAKFTEVYAKRKFGSTLENWKYIKFYKEVSPRANRKFFSVENTKMKALNDSLGDYGFVDAVNNKYKETLLEKIEKLKAELPDLKIITYNDAKSLQFVFDGKIPNNLEMRLNAIFQETNKEFAEYMKAHSLLREKTALREADKPEEFFKAGFGKTGDEVNLAARYSREQTGSSRIYNFDSPTLQAQVKRDVESIKTESESILKNYQGREVLNFKENDLSPRMWDILRKNETPEQVVTAYKNEFGRPLSSDEAKQLLQFKQLNEKLTPAILTESRVNISFADATQGGIAVDKVGLGSENLSAVHQGIRDSSSYKEALEKINQKTNSVTDQVTAHEKGLQDHLAQNSDKSQKFTLVRGGDNYKITPTSRPLSENDKWRFIDRLASTHPSLEINQQRVVFIPSGIVDKSVPDLLVGHGYEIEKTLRKNFPTSFPRSELNSTTFAIDMKTVKAGQGEVRLMLNKPGRFSNEEKQQIQKSFQEAIEKFNKQNNTSYKASDIPFDERVHNTGTLRRLKEAEESLNKQGIETRRIVTSSGNVALEVPVQQTANEDWVKISNRLQGAKNGSASTPGAQKPLVIRFDHEFDAGAVYSGSANQTEVRGYADPEITKDKLIHESTHYGTNRLLKGDAPNNPNRALGIRFYTGENTVKKGLPKDYKAYFQADEVKAYYKEGRGREQSAKFHKLENSTTKESYEYSRDIAQAGKKLLDEAIAEVDKNFDKIHIKIGQRFENTNVWDAEIPIKSPEGEFIVKVPFTMNGTKDLSSPRTQEAFKRMALSKLKQAKSRMEYYQTQSENRLRNLQN
jgi:hypothetical protein